MRAIKDESLQASLSSGSKKRLRQYRANLSANRDKVIFDDRVLDVLRKYVYDSKDLASVVGYLNNLRDDDGYLYSSSLKQYEKMLPAFDLFQGKDYTSFRWNRHYQKSLKELKGRFARFKLKSLQYRSDADIVNALPKTNTHSGWTYILSGKKKKGENLEEILQKYTKEEEAALKSGSFNKPILPGTRTQVSGAFTDDGEFTGHCKHKTRVISMIDMNVIIAELKFAKPFQDCFGGYDSYAGGKSSTAISQIIGNWRSEYGNWLSLDYSSFDQTISSWLIRDAFDIIASAFTEYDQELWNVVVNDFIHKNFVLPDRVIHSDKGVPSGSMFTQIVDSIVNMLVIKTYLNSKGIKGDMIVMGDDNLLFTRTEVGSEEISSYIRKCFGLVVNPDKCSSGKRWEDPNFLSRKWKANGQWRAPRILVSKMLFPERYRNYHEQVSPELVVYSYILEYRPAMDQLIDVMRFEQENDFTDADLRSVDSRYVPGALRYIMDYQVLVA